MDWSQVFLIIVFFPFFQISCLGSKVSLEEFNKAFAQWNKSIAGCVKFQQTKIISSLNVHLKSQGLLCVELEKSVKWIILKPEPLEMILTKTGIHLKTQTQNIDYGINEIPQSQNQGLKNLLNLFFQNTHDLFQTFEMEKLSKSNFALVPKDEKDLFKKIEIYIQPKNNKLQKIILHEKSDDQILINFILHP